MSINLEEKTLSTSEVYSGKFLKVFKDKVKLPDGRISEREYLKHPGASTIIPLLDNGNVLVERQWRYPLHKSFIELPAGKLDAEEDPLTCAKRELKEETGYFAHEWFFLNKINNAIGYSNESIYIFLARDLIKDKQQLDPGEFVELIEISVEDLISKCCNGEITDVKTIIGALWLEKFLSKSFSVTKEK